MYCENCGQQVQAGQHYCQACGKVVGAVATPSAPKFGDQGPTAPQGSRHDLVWHVRLLGILWIIFAALRLVPAVALMSFSRIGIPFIPWPMRGWLHPVLAPLGFLFSALALAGLIAGWGLLQREPWARMLALIVGAIALIHPPFGTALGIYTLWVLLPSESEVQYRTISRP